MPNHKTVEDIMTRDMLVLREEDSLLHVGEQMQAAHVHHLPVVDGDKLVGIVSHRDILRFSVSALTKDPVHQSANDTLEENAFVASVMVRNPLCVPPDTTVARAASLLLKHHIWCLPVTSPDGTLLGLLTEGDCVRLLVRLLDA